MDGRNTEWKNFFCPKVMLERIDGKEKSAKWELIFNECSLGYG